MTPITLHKSVCDATPGMCAHDWQCQRTCPGKPARYSAQGKHADTLRQRIQPHHAADPQATPQASDEDTDRATAPVPSADEAFAGIAAIGFQQRQLDSIWQRLGGAWQGIARHLR